MITFLLIRHATTDHLGRVLSGRAPGVHLNSAGALQAERLAARLADTRIAGIYAGPLDRARETAAPLADKHKLSAIILPALDEIDFGLWTLLPFATLDERPDWREWNAARDTAIPPNGERMAEAQWRVSTELERLSVSLPAGVFAIVSHGDVIKAALMRYLEIPLGLMHRLEISPASVSTLRFCEGNPRVLSVNA